MMMKNKNTKVSTKITTPSRISEKVNPTTTRLSPKKGKRIRIN